MPDRKAEWSSVDRIRIQENGGGDVFWEADLPRCQWGQSEDHTDFIRIGDKKSCVSHGKAF